MDTEACSQYPAILKDLCRIMLLFWENNQSITLSKDGNGQTGPKAGWKSNANIQNQITK